MRKLITNHPELSLEKLTKELSRTKERRQAIRILGLIKLEEGKTRKEIAEFLKCHRNTIHDWVKRVNKEGLAGLKEKEGRGLKGQLLKGQKEQLKNELLKSPVNYGFTTNIWTGKVLQEHLKRNYHLKYKKSAIYNLFDDLGFSLQRPSRKLLGAQKGKQEEFKTNLKKNHLSNW